MKSGVGRSRWANLAMGVLAAVIAVGLITPAATSVFDQPVASAAEPPADPVALGAYAKPRNGQSERQAVEALEAQIGRKLEVVRVFETWDEAFPDSYHTWLRDGGRSIILSVKPNRLNGAKVTWPSIATAAPGSQVDREIRSWAQRVKGYGVPLYVTLNHEPERAGSTSSGTNADFIAAWRHWVDVFRQEGVTNAKFMWIMTDYAFELPTSDRRNAPKWYPGDAWVDAIASDPYNWHTCRPGINNAWRSLQRIVEPFRAFGALHPDKPLWLAEWASTEDAAVPGRKAAWIDEARALFKQPGWEQFDGIVYFNAAHIQSGVTVCQWYTDTSAGSLSSFRAMALDPFYSGTAFGQDGGPTTTTTTTSTSSTTTTAPTTTTSTTVPPPGGRTALLVVGSTTLNAGDSATRSRLAAAGYAVRVLDDSAVTSSVAEDLVVVSSSVSSSAVAGTYRLTPVPVLVYKPWIYNDMGLASAFGSASGTGVSITSPSSPLAAGLSGTASLTTTRGPVPWGTPAPSAEVIATSTGQASLFAYDTGDQLIDGSQARSCRIALPFSDQTLGTATAQGTGLLDAAIDWAGRC